MPASSPVSRWAWGIAEDAGIGVRIDGFKLDLFAGATLVESPELTSDAIAAQTGSNRVEGNSSRQFTLFFDTNAEGVTVAVLTGTYTDGLGNVLQTEDDFDVICGSGFSLHPARGAWAAAG